MDTDHDLVTALRRAGTDDPRVDTGALVAGAHRRARTLRTRRRGVAGAVAVLALAVPVGVSQWPGADPAPTVVAAPTAPPTTVAPDGEVADGALLPDTAVEQVLPGAQGTTEASAAPEVRGDYGMCTDEVLPAEAAGTTALLGLRTRTWTTVPTVADPFPASVSQSVRVFSPGGAGLVVTFARDQLGTACASPDETTPWSAVPSADGSVTAAGAALGQDSVTGFAAMGTVDAPVWRTRVVVAQGDVALDLRTELATPTAAQAVATTTDLARDALAAVVATVPAAQGQR